MAREETENFPPSRIGVEEIYALSGALGTNPIVQVVLQAVGGFVLILNRARQVLATNPEVLRALGVTDDESLLGLRPGDLFGCANALGGPDGCHTASQCQACGAYLVLLHAEQSESATTGECYLTRRVGGRAEALEFKVRATPLDVNGHRLFVLVLQDISDAKRRSQLERAFFHDLQNSLQALQGWSELLELHRLPPDRAAQQILALSKRLSQEVSSHRMISLAEQGVLSPQPVEVPVRDFLRDISDYFQGHPAAIGRQIHIETPGPVVIDVDPALLMRVLVNMVKNALEAITPGQDVWIRFGLEEGRPTFRVRNPGHMAPSVAAQVFQRSFTTKGEWGRGLGTYSMKLLGETYLRGEVGFEQNPGNDEVEFYIKLSKQSCDLAIR